MILSIWHLSADVLEEFSQNIQRSILYHEWRHQDLLFDVQVNFGQSWKSDYAWQSYKMLLIFSQTTEEDEIQTHEQTWCRPARFNDHDFQQILQKQIEESLKNKMRTQSWQENK